MPPVNDAIIVWVDQRNGVLEGSATEEGARAASTSGSAVSGSQAGLLDQELELDLTQDQDQILRLHIHDFIS